MNFTLNIVIIAVVVIVYFAIVCKANQPSYQVSLYLHLHPQEPPIHLCNGVIVQSRLILTTATCVYYKLSQSDSPVNSIAAKMISVTSGSSTSFKEELALQVADIVLADKFNYTTGKNDLALLRLNGILPLDTNSDISWITLEDDEKYDSPCLASFYLRNLPNGAPNYIQSEQLPILGSEFCVIASEQIIERENDICSLYYLPSDFECNSLQTLQNYNGDRGTGLICGNKLVGLLSTILPYQNLTDCIEKPLRAYFTAIAPHIAWIFNVITEEDIKMLDEGEYISSSPYAGETNAVLEPQVTESEITTTVYTKDTLGITEVSNQTNASARDAINCKLLFCILGICLLLEPLSR